MKEFKTHYNQDKFPKQFIVLSDEILTEVAGYISAKQRIENLLFAGQRLLQSRSEMYDYTGEPPEDDQLDPSRSPNFDLADATQNLLNVEARAKQKQRNKASEVVNDKKEPIKNPEDFPI